MLRPWSRGVTSSSTSLYIESHSPKHHRRQTRKVSRARKRGSKDAKNDGFEKEDLHVASSPYFSSSAKTSNSSGSSLSHEKRERKEEIKQIDDYVCEVLIQGDKATVVRSVELNLPSLPPEVPVATTTTSTTGGDDAGENKDNLKEKPLSKESGTRSTESFNKTSYRGSSSSRRQLPKKKSTLIHQCELGENIKITKKASRQKFESPGIMGFASSTSRVSTKLSTVNNSNKLSKIRKTRTEEKDTQARRICKNNSKQDLVVQVPKDKENDTVMNKESLPLEPSYNYHKVPRTPVISKYRDTNKHFVFSEEKTNGKATKSSSEMESLQKSTDE
eukprot:g2265.t1